MVSKRNFLKQFWKDRQMVGAVSPSTRFLGEKMLENSNFEQVTSIVRITSYNVCYTKLLRPILQLMKHRLPYLLTLSDTDVLPEFQPLTDPKQLRP